MTESTNLSGEQVQKLQEAWNRRLPKPTPNSFGIQWDSHWDDYGRWEDRTYWMDDEDEDSTVRFATLADATDFLDREESVRFEKAHAEWRERKVEADKEFELHRKRVEVLKAAGLWDDEHQVLLRRGGVGHEPKWGWEKRYRIVPDAEMDEPISEECPTCHRPFRPGDKGD
jgi:hypothetical protein